MTKSWNEQTPQLLPNSEIYKFCMIWDWSPDGKKLFGLFIPKQGKSYRGFYSFETGKSEAAADLKLGATPNWMADSNSVIYASEGKIFLSDITTKQDRELLAIPQEKIVNAGINRENNLIYFTVAKTESDIRMLDASQN